MAKRLAADGRIGSAGSNQAPRCCPRSPTPRWMR